MPAKPISDPSQLNELILNLIFQMNEETGSYNDDSFKNYPIGLWWYSQHRKPKNKVMTSEVCWSERLAEMLDNLGYAASSEYQYPDSRQRCDVRANIGWDNHAWIELKGSWRAVFDPPRPNKSYEKHLIAAAQDVRKLEKLPPSHASATSFVLVGFDQPETDKTITESDLSEIRNLTMAGGWFESYRTWNVKMSLSFRVQCWAWSRRLPV